MGLLNCDLCRAGKFDAARKDLQAAGRSLGDAIREVFRREYGGEPMDDPKVDAAFLDALDLVSGIPSDEMEAAFYDNEPSRKGMAA